MAVGGEAGWLAGCGPSPAPPGLVRVQCNVVNKFRLKGSLSDSLLLRWGLWDFRWGSIALV